MCVTSDWGRKGTTHQARATVGVTPAVRAGVRRQGLMKRLIASLPCQDPTCHRAPRKKLHSCPFTDIPHPLSSNFIVPSPPVSRGIGGSLFAFLLGSGIWLGNIKSVFRACIMCVVYNIYHFLLEAFHKLQDKEVENGDKLYTCSLLYSMQKRNFEVWQLGWTLTFEYMFPIPECFIAILLPLFSVELGKIDNSSMLCMENILFMNSTQSQGYMLAATLLGFLSRFSGD